MANPRIEDLRKRIEKDPGSRLFAQLAEELRKDGELEDAIRVAREGLQKHPNYPSARMTLGRALLDTGDWASARTEFELVLKSAADNILASRYLGECLENLGERDAAISRYKATLAMAPGEKHVVARLQELEKGFGAGAPPAAAKPMPAPASAPSMRPAVGLRPASAPAPPAPVAPPPPAPTPAAVRPPVPEPEPPPAAAAPPVPIPLATVEGEMELETSREPGPPTPVKAADAPLAPIPLVDADEEFELEKPYESPTTGIGTGKPLAGAAASYPSAATPASGPAPGAPEDTEEQEFELEAPHEAPSTGWAASIRPLPVVEEPPPPRPAPPVPEPPKPSPPPAAPVAAPPPAPMPAPVASPSPPPTAAAPSPTATASGGALISPTLGELYFNQGFTDRAIEVYRELSAREPGNERLSARLRELEKVQRTLSAEPAAPERPGKPEPADGSADDRRQAIERTIARLEGLLSAIRKG